MLKAMETCRTWYRASTEGCAKLCKACKSSVIVVGHVDDVARQTTMRMFLKKRQQGKRNRGWLKKRDRRWSQNCMLWIDGENKQKMWKNGDIIVYSKICSAFK